MEGFFVPFSMSVYLQKILTWKRWISLGLVWILPACAGIGAMAGGLQKATIEELKGEVVLKKDGVDTMRPACMKEEIVGKDVVRTGKKSRAELEFPDQSICRLGSNTIFSFDPQTRNMEFSQGVALVHVPPYKGGARIGTTAATAAIQGDTILLRSMMMPDGTPGTQFTSLSPAGGPTDGSIVVTLNRNPDVSFQLEGGQVAIVPDLATSLSDVSRAEIDVAILAAQSSLLQNLPPSADKEIHLVARDQARDFASGAAERTQLALNGNGTIHEMKESPGVQSRPGMIRPELKSQLPPQTLQNQTLVQAPLLSKDLSVLNTLPLPPIYQPPLLTQQPLLVGTLGGATATPLLFPREVLFKPPPPPPLPK